MLSLELTQKQDDRIIENFYHDAYIHTEDSEVIPIHKVLVASISPYLHRYFISRPPGSNVHDVLLPNTKAKIVKQALDVIYTGSSQIDLQDAAQVEWLLESLLEVKVERKVYASSILSLSRMPIIDSMDTQQDILSPALPNTKPQPSPALSPSPLEAATPSQSHPKSPQPQAPSPTTLHAPALSPSPPKSPQPPARSSGTPQSSQPPVLPSTLPQLSLAAQSTVEQPSSLSSIQAESGGRSRSPIEPSSTATSSSFHLSASLYKSNEQKGHLESISHEVITEKGTLVMFRCNICSLKSKFINQAEEHFFTNHLEKEKARQIVKLAMEKIKVFDENLKELDKAIKPNCAKSILQDEVFELKEKIEAVQANLSDLGKTLPGTIHRKRIDCKEKLKNMIVLTNQLLIKLWN